MDSNIQLLTKAKLLNIIFFAIILSIVTIPLAILNKTASQELQLLSKWLTWTFSQNKNGSHT